MKMHIKTIIILALAVMWVPGGAAWAQNIKQRMLDRLPVIVELKAKGIVGENNQGYLDILKSGQAPTAVIDAENRDRRAAYQVIAEQTKTHIDVVGQRRAIQIAEKADSGEWLQDTTGRWYQKP